MESIGVRDLRQRASEILKEVEAGKSFTVTVAGRPVAQLVPIESDGPQTWVPWEQIKHIFTTPDDPTWDAERRGFGTVGIDNPWTR